MAQRDSTVSGALLEPVFVYLAFIGPCFIRHWKGLSPEGLNRLSWGSRTDQLFAEM